MWQNANDYNQFSQLKINFPDYAKQKFTDMLKKYRIDTIKKK